MGRDGRRGRDEREKIKRKKEREEGVSKGERRVKKKRDE